MKILISKIKMKFGLLDLPNDVLFCIISNGDCRMIHYLMKTSTKIKKMIVDNLFSKNNLSYYSSLNLGEIVNSTIVNENTIENSNFIDLLHITYFISTNYSDSFKWKSNIYLLIYNLINEIKRVNVKDFSVMRNLTIVFNKMHHLEVKILEITKNNQFTKNTFERINKNTNDNFIGSF